MHLPVGLGTALGDVDIVLEDRLSPITPIHQVIKGSLILGVAAPDLEMSILVSSYMGDPFRSGNATLRFLAVINAHRAA